MSFIDKIRERYNNVWRDKYPLYWHYIDIACGIIAAIIFVAITDYSPGVKAGLFFAIIPIGYLLALAFTYGVVRARNAWSENRK